MAQIEKLSGRIQDFIGLVERYTDAGTRYERAERTALRRAQQGEDAHALDAAIPEYHAQFKQARQAVLTAAPPLVNELERAGVNSVPLLRLREAVGGRGGSASIRKLWPKLKADLQRAAIREGLPPAPTMPSGAGAVVPKGSKRQKHAGRKADPEIANRDDAWLVEYEAGVRSDEFETAADFQRHLGDDYTYDQVRKALERARKRSRQRQKSR
jgi:hypothetical protein